MPPVTSPRRPLVGAGRNGAQAVPGPAPAPTGRRRNTAGITVGVLCIAAGALAGLLAVKSGSARESVLATVHSVAPGHVIQPGDLRIVDVSTDGGLAFVPASDEGSVVGRPASVALAPGAPITRSQVGSAAVVAQGDAVVGVLCKDGQYPPALAAGDRVAIVDAGASSLAGATAPAPQAGTSTGDATISATVISVDTPSDTASVGSVVSLRVRAADAPTVARLGGAGRIALILLPPAP